MKPCDVCGNEVTQRWRLSTQSRMPHDPSRHTANNAALELLQTKVCDRLCADEPATINRERTTDALFVRRSLQRHLRGNVAAYACYRCALPAIREASCIAAEKNLMDSTHARPHERWILPTTTPSAAATSERRIQSSRRRRHALKPRTLTPGADKRHAAPYSSMPRARWESSSPERRPPPRNRPIICTHSGCDQDNETTCPNRHLGR